MTLRWPALATVVALCCGLSSAHAQELEPRAYRALPVGLHFGLLVYSFSTGNVVVDPPPPVEGLELDVSMLTAGYLTTFPLFGRSSAFSIILPYVVRATGTGTLNDVVITGTRSGPADLRLRLSHLVIGGAAQRLAEFAPQRHRRLLAAQRVTASPSRYREAPRSYREKAGWASRSFGPLHEPRPRSARRPNSYSVEIVLLDMSLPVDFKRLLGVFPEPKQQ